MIERYLKRIAVHDAVYWASPTPRADGSSSYAAPVALRCFWKESVESVPDRDMKEVSIKAHVYVFQDLDEQGMLFKGTLDDLTQAQKDDPRRISRAYEISRFVRTPSLYLKNKFNRCAIISPEKARIPPGIGR